MKPVYLVALAAILGAGIAVAVIIYGDRSSGPGNQPMPPFNPPFKSYVAGTGVTEPTTGKIKVGTPVAGIVWDIPVHVGDQLEAGDPLFTIDDRDLQAQLVTARARVEEAAAALRKPRDRLDYQEHLEKRDPEAVSERELTELRDDEAQADAALKVARARVEELQRRIDRRVVRAPVAGEVLQLQIHRGEYVEGSAVSPLLLFGGNDRMNVRVDVDEHDAWRVHAGAEAVAFLRGNPDIRIPLRYEYTEPYLIPKTSLTGRSTERTDTRVLQVLYSFDPKGEPVYMGQQLDVMIRAPAATQTEPEH
jgi:multidrug efflux pump subunit AcrA (membrane-fusion protein)